VGVQVAYSDYFLNVVSFLGLLGQIGITLLLLLLFLLLRRNVSRGSHYFVTWTRAWFALTGAIVILAVGFVGLPHVLAPEDRAAAWWFPLAYIGYQLGKLFYLLLLLAGTLELAHGTLPRRLVSRGAVAVTVYALLSFVLSGDFNTLVLWQALAFVVTCGYTGWCMLRLPRVRRTLGVAVTGGTLLLTACMWMVYGVTFYLLVTRGDGIKANHFVGIVASYNSFYDTLLQILLAFGMVLMLQEDGRRELDLAHHQLLHESLTDSLTGAYNRLAFTRGAFLHAEELTEGAVVMFDLDNLKQTNDGHGHEAGDMLLKYFTTTVRQGLRPLDQLYRWGGDEFLLLMPGAAIEAVTQRLGAIVQDALPLQLDGGSVQVKLEVSFGGADYAGPGELRGAVRKADAAMYAHKRARKTGPPLA
jgi:diguanylate cyclase (GGDEF)-like protein